jgi:hypothetical protein
MRKTADPENHCTRFSDAMGITLLTLPKKSSKSRKGMRKSR